MEEYVIYDLDDEDLQDDPRDALLVRNRRIPFRRRPFGPPPMARHPRPPMLPPPRPMVAPLPPPQALVVKEQRSFGNLTTGELVVVATQVLAAMTPLPGAPAASGDPAKDLAALIEYQALLAQHAKRDELLRTVGNLAEKFIG